ncbi:apolipoprotein N-acyltransferase [Aurantiacibacter poecillastricola]|uniref:apolipoprotein N-acyltransferase n=1 Tax=Aurantiacibacter poecillastricola TaxID=3064385 RepID=UPI00273E1024|nr:apolipoprotein N-acyltransferase [Aurantiacibacter sp. 219JJ12-13]MDP5260224.1 apolipoprotein N-acyltransferase [Aurantiacibacter sp. 219JJ12-13]
MTSSFTLSDRLAAHPRLAALGLGLLSAIGFQPLGLWPVALLAVGLFALLAARATSWLRAFGLGWLFGVAHFTLGNSWIATAFTYQAEMPAVLGWVAVPLLALYLAVYPGLAALVARVVAKQSSGWSFALAFAGAWIVTEWMRGWVFTGYAWNPFGMVLLGPFDRPGLAGVAPVMGTYALSGLAVFLGCALVLLLRERNWLASGTVAALLVAGMAWPAPEAEDSDLRVTIAQPDIRQETLSDSQFYEANFQRLAQLSPRLDDSADPRIVLWPESGMVDYLREGYPQRYYDSTTALGSPAYARRRLGATVGAGSVLLTGAVDLEIGPDQAGFMRALGARNAVTAVSDEGELLGGYAKAHLVPYGEYLPFREILEPLGLSRLVAGSIDFWPGPGPRTLDLGEHGRAGVQICYEIVFSGEVTEGGNRPDYIFNPSNDGWFGAFGPPQHLAQARMRAIEEGLPVLRATTTGISAVIDSRGVVRDHLGNHVRDRIDANVPAAAPPTLFARMGNWLPLLWAGMLLLAGFVARARAAR